MLERNTDAPVARSFGLHLRAVREDVREADFVASTEAIDSYDEIVEQIWRLDRYRANPVALFAHQSRELPIGQCPRCEMGQLEGRPALECTIKFASKEANPMAECVWQSVRERTLRAVSVGFFPHEIRYEKRDGRDVYVLSDNELYEISVTPIPANPEALSKMKAKAIEAAQGARIECAQEINMDLEQAKAQLAQREAEVRAKEAELLAKGEALKSAEVKVTALEAQNAKLAEERDTATKGLTEARAEVEALKDTVIKQEVDALVGVKLTPAEAPMFAKLAKTDRSLFDEMIAQRAPLATLTQVVPAEKGVTNTAADGASGSDDLVAEANRLGAKAVA